MSDLTKNLGKEELEGLFRILRTRFEKNKQRHQGLEWASVQSRLEAKPEKCRSLYEMEETGGEPDVVGIEQSSGKYLFYDCSPESPKGRRSLCYDQEAWLSRKEHKPKDSAQGLAAEMGVEILTEEEYIALQHLGNFDAKTSSWLQTPSEVRKLGGAIYGDFRYGRVFVGHNGAESYYAVRGFRACLKV